MSKLRWGILSTAKIGVEKVIPAMQRAANCEIVAIASDAGAERARPRATSPEARGARDLVAHEQVTGRAVFPPRRGGL